MGCGVRRAKAYAGEPRTFEEGVPLSFVRTSLRRAVLLLLLFEFSSTRSDPLELHNDRHGRPNGSDRVMDDACTLAPRPPGLHRVKWQGYFFEGSIRSGARLVGRKSVDAVHFAPTGGRCMRDHGPHAVRRVFARDGDQLRCCFRGPRIGRGVEGSSGRSRGAAAETDPIPEWSAGPALKKTWRKAAPVPTQGSVERSTSAAGHIGREAVRTVRSRCVTEGLEQYREGPQSCSRCSRHGFAMSARGKVQGSLRSRMTGRHAGCARSVQGAE